MPNNGRIQEPVIWLAVDEQGVEGAHGTGRADPGDASRANSNAHQLGNGRPVDILTTNAARLSMRVVLDGSKTSRGVDL